MPEMWTATWLFEKVWFVQNLFSGIGACRYDTGRSEGKLVVSLKQKVIKAR